MAHGDDDFAIYYILIAFYAALVFHDRRAIAFQFGLASLMALAPIAYEPEIAARPSGRASS